MVEKQIEKRIGQIANEVNTLQRGKNSRNISNRFLIKVKIFIEEVWLIVMNRRSKNLNYNFENKNKSLIATGIDYDKCLVLSLERRKDRQDFMDVQLKREGVSYEFFGAIDGQVIEINNIAEILISQKSKKFLSKGEIATALSHYSIWLAMLENDWENLLIFEDDTVIKDGLHSSLKIVMNEVPDYFDLLIIGSCGDIYMRANVSEHLFIPYNFCCADGYIISRRGARKLLELATPMDLKSGGIDIVMSNLVKRNQLKVYHAKPLLCNQKELFSSDIIKGDINQ